MSIAVSHIGGTVYGITFHGKRGMSQLCKGPKFHTKVHYELNNKLRSWVLRFGLDHTVHTGMLQYWFRELMDAAVFTAQPDNTSKSLILIRLESYPLLLGLFT